MAAKEKGSGMWKAGKLIGMALVIIGIAVGIYFIYLWSTAGARSASFGRGGSGFPTTRGFNATGFNQTGFNQSEFNSTRAERYGAGGVFVLNQYLEGIIIGVLAILLGFMTFKYAGLKTATIGKK
jgi:hypothetical protein